MNSTVRTASIALALVTAGPAAAQNGFAAFEGLDTSTRIVNDRQVELANRLSGGVSTRNAMTGLSGAAADMAGASLWVGTGGSHIANSAAALRYKGDQFNGLLGADWAAEPWLIVGLALGGEGRFLDTQFNDGKLRSSGFSVSPYAIVRLDTNYFLDANFSYAHLSNDEERNDSFTTSPVRGEYDSNRYVATINLHGVWNIDDWRLNATVGYLHVHQDDGAYDHFDGCTELFTGCDRVPDNHVDLGQFRVGGRVGYALGDFVPYVIGRVEYNVIRPSSFGIVLKDRLGGFVGAGLRWNITRTLTATAQGNTIVGRENATDYGGYATLRFSW